MVSQLVCDKCKEKLIETKRKKHPRLALHEIRTYNCATCGWRIMLTAPLPDPNDRPVSDKRENGRVQ
jgi:DNA-directed RNA polymerase subunit RPC12/RpoP